MHDWAVTYILTDTLAACKHWNVQPPAPNIWEQAVESDRPVLMLVGTFDSDSAPLLSEAYVDAFANGYYYELPYGHALLFSELWVGSDWAVLLRPNQGARRQLYRRDAGKVGLAGVMRMRVPHSSDDDWMCRSAVCLCSIGKEEFRCYMQDGSRFRVC